MSRRSITDEEREKAIQMFNENMDTYSIGKRLGIHEATISQVIHEERDSRNVEKGEYQTGQVKNYVKR